MCNSKFKYLENAQDAVTKWHTQCGVNCPKSPQFREYPIRKLRMNLLFEEFEEYVQAEKDNNMVEVADALCDMVWVILGTCSVYGIDMEDVFAEVTRSNYSKFDDYGNPVLRRDGKVLKSINYSPPNIKSALYNAGGQYNLPLNCVD